MTTATDYPHIERDGKGCLRVRGTPYKVLVLLRDHTEWNWGPSQIARQHPGLTIAQVHGILGYYYDHKVEIDTQLAAQDAEAEALRLSTGPSPTMQRLRELKDLRRAAKLSVAEMSREESLVVALHYYESLEIQEIAEVLGISDADVRMLLSRAIARIQARLSEPPKAVVGGSAT